MHIHSVLSPCGDLEMSPATIIRIAKEKQLDMIAITDHNTTLHCKLARQIGLRSGISVIPGVEVTTREEVHCLAYFPDDKSMDSFQEYIGRKILRLPNKPEKFGYQVVLDENENIIQEVEYMLGSSLQASIDEVQEKVAELNGIFIPAHIDRPRNSVLSQLGFFPETLKCDAFEISFASDKNEFLLTHPELGKLSSVRNSDAHFTENIARITTSYSMEEPTFSEFKMALHGEEGRSIL